MADPNEAVRRLARILGQESPEDRARRGYERRKYGIAADDLYDMGAPAARKRLHAGKYGPPGSPGHEFVSGWLQGHPAPPHWYQRPLGVVVLMVAAGILVAAVTTWLQK